MSMGTFGIVDIYCDMTTADGGWIVIQRNTKVPWSRSPRYRDISFNRNWREYEDGFGKLSENFWYGLKQMYLLTQTGQWEMRVDFRENRNSNSHSYIHYNHFKVGSPSEQYKLTVGGYTGGDGDYFAAANNRSFSTLDNDNDLSSSKNCAMANKYGWWFRGCNDFSPNRKPPVRDWEQYYYIDVKIRSKDCL